MNKDRDQQGLPPAGSLLFVYGTLQQGGQYHRLLETCGAVFLGEGRTVEAYPLIVTDYPCLLDQPGRGHRVVGELYRLARPEDWRAIDTLEGHPLEYRRRLERVDGPHGQVRAWTYVYQEWIDPSPAQPLLERFQAGACR